MSFTGQLGTTDSKLGEIVLGAVPVELLPAIGLVEPEESIVLVEGG